MEKDNGKKVFVKINDKVAASFRMVCEKSKDDGQLQFVARRWFDFARPFQKATAIIMSGTEVLAEIEIDVDKRVNTAHRQIGRHYYWVTVTKGAAVSWAVTAGYRYREPRVEQLPASMSQSEARA